MFNKERVVKYVFLGIGFLLITGIILQLIYPYKMGTNIYMLVATIISVAGIVFLLIFLKLFFKNPIDKISYSTERLAHGNINCKVENVKSESLKTLSDNLNHVIQNLDQAGEFARQVGEGNLDAPFETKGQNDKLGHALIEMRNKLNELAKSENKRNWAIKGIAQFSEILQNNNQDIQALSEEIIKNLVKYLEAKQGGVFLINDDNEEDKFIELKAAYAYGRKKYISKRIEMDEGLVGQCIQEKESIFMTDVPDDYVNITSGLGEATPRCVLLAPIKKNEEVFGVIEIASFNIMEDYQVEFVEDLCEDVAITLSTVRMNIHTQRLLQESQQTNQELQAQEEEMRQNAEELQSIQEELNRQLKKLEEETAYSNSIVDAIDKSNASIEFDPEGKILKVNDMFLSVMGYTNEEIIDQNEDILIPEDEKNSGRYKLMWENLVGGSYFSGEFKRISKEGKEVWLNGSYNPVFNAEGEVYKFIMFAQFTTEQKEKELEVKGHLDALENAFPVFTLKEDMSVFSPNKLFTELSGLKRLQLKKKTFKDLVSDKDYVESEQFEEDWKKIWQGEPLSKTLTYNFDQNNTKYLLTFFNPVINLAGNVHKVFVILTDVTDQIKLHKELEENQRSLSQTIDKMSSIQENLKEKQKLLGNQTELLNKSCSLFYLDKDHHLEYINDCFKYDFGLNEEDEKDLNVKELTNFMQADSLITFNKQDVNELKQGQIIRNVYQFLRNDNSIMWGDTTIAPLVNGKGEIEKYIGIITDITHQVTLEETLEKVMDENELNDLSFQFINSGTSRKVRPLEDYFTSQNGNKDVIDINENEENIPMFEFTTDLIITNVNTQAANALSSKQSELINQNIENFLVIEDEDEKINLFNKIVTGNVVQRKLNWKSEKGAKELKFLFSPVFDNEGRVEKIMAILSESSTSLA